MTGWLIFIGFGVFILILRNDQKIEAWWRNGKARATGTTMDKHSQELYEQEWSRGKHVTFMEAEPQQAGKYRYTDKELERALGSAQYRRFKASIRP